MTNPKESGQPDFKEYLTLTQDPAAKPFLTEMKLMFETVSGHEDDIFLFLYLLNSDSGHKPYYDKRDQLASNLGFSSEKLELYLKGLRNIDFGRYFPKGKRHTLQQASDDEQPL